MIKNLHLLITSLGLVCALSLKPCDEPLIPKIQRKAIMLRAMDAPTLVIAAQVAETIAERSGNMVLFGIARSFKVLAQIMYPHHLYPLS